MTTYITVAIPFVNAEPHLGYAYELVRADIVARALRDAGDDVRFLGGTDEYSLKNVLAAEAAGLSTRELVDRNASRFTGLAEALGISFDDFIRTSADPRHVPAVHRLWQACAARGDLYRRAYEGDYCVGCERFVTDGELVDGRCPEHGVPPERVAEENWFFRLSAYADRLDDLVRHGRLEIHPAPFRDEVLGFIQGGLDDISVSRSVARARGWGVPVPGDETQIVYVWFDALTNYLSALRFGETGTGENGSDEYRRWWLAADRRIHVIGKGILRFHAVYWPAFLASAGAPLPTQIDVHPYLTVDGEKISKSGGNRIDPVELIERSGVDALRWWFARDVGALSDTDFTEERLVHRTNDDLAHGLGNVTNRIATLVHRHRDGVVPTVGATALDAVAGLDRTVRARLVEADLRGATGLVIDAVSALNRDLEATAPWNLARAEAAAGRCDDRLDQLLSRYVLSARLVARAVAPIVPTLAARLLDQLGGENAAAHLHLPAARPVFARLELC